MLIGNGSVLKKSLARFHGPGGLAQTRANFLPYNVTIIKQQIFGKKASYPSGYPTGQAFRMPISNGELASVNRMSGVGSLTGTAVAARLSSATLEGTGTISNAALSVLSNAAANIGGAGDLSATIAAVSNMQATIAGSGALSGNLSAIVPLEATLTGSGGISANLKGVGRLEADITPFTELSPQNLAQAVLNAEVESGFAIQAALRLILSATAGKVSGAETTTITFRNVNDDKNRIIATVDSNGNRTSLTYDVGD